MNRACLPIASLVLRVTTSCIVFQLLFINLKDLDTLGPKDNPLKRISVNQGKYAGNNNNEFGANKQNSEDD